MKSKTYNDMRKMKMPLKLLLLLLFCIPIQTIVAQKVTLVSDNLTYTVDTSANMAELNGPESSFVMFTDLVIPDYIDYNGSQIPVTSIKDYAFKENKLLKGSLTIGNNVQTIGNESFYKCSGLTASLTIGDNVQTIGNDAFSFCSGLTGSLTIPNSVQTIGNWAFYGCKGLTGSLTIGNNVQAIEAFAFSFCSDLTGALTIPNSVQTIGAGAFYYCSGLTGSLTIGDNVQTIGEQAFSDCSGLTGSLTIPNSVQTIGNSAFYRCSGLTGSLTIPNSVQIIGNQAFYYCSGLTGSLTIPNSVQTIGNSAFYGCKGLNESLTIPNSVQTIGKQAFQYCNFREVKSLAEYPAKAGNQVFYNFYTSPLYVPSKSVNLYKNTTEWEKFKDINPLQIEATDITLNKTELSLLIGQEETLIATLTPEDASTAIIWFVESGGEDIISVSQDGKVMALSVGKATVVATTGDASATCKVMVVKPTIDPEQIVLNVNAVQLNLYDKFQLEATILPEESTDKSIVWTSSNEHIATVSDDGLVQALAIGNATITASCGDASSECFVTVIEYDAVERLLADPNTKISIFSLDGILIKKDCTTEDLRSHSKGIYIIVSGKERFKISI